MSILVIASAALGAAMLTRGHNWGDDFAAYLMQAQSLLDGNVRESIQRNAFTITSSSPPPGPIVTAWGYPLLLSPALHFFGLDLFWLKLVNVAAYAAFLIAFHALARLRLPAAPALLLTGVFAFNPALLQAEDQLITDIAFLFFSTLSIYLIEHNLRADATRPIAGSLGLGLAIFTAYSVRAIGGLLLGALAVATVGRGGHPRDLLKSSAFSLPFLSFLGLAGLQWAFLPIAEGHYLAFFEWPTPGILFENASAYFWVPTEMFKAVPFGSAFGALMLLCFVLGIISRPLRLAPLNIYILLLFGSLIPWSFTPMLRFVFPILPLIALIAAEGWMILSAKVPAALQPAAQAIQVGLPAGLVLLSLVASVNLARINLHNDRGISGPFDAISAEMFAFIRSQTPPDSVIIFFKPRAMRLLTGRDAFRSTLCEDLARGDFAVFHKQMGAGTQVEEPGACSNVQLEPVFDNSNFTVFALER